MQYFEGHIEQGIDYMNLRLYLINDSELFSKMVNATDDYINETA